MVEHQWESPIMIYDSRQHAGDQAGARAVAALECGTLLGPHDRGARDAGAGAPEALVAG